MQVVYRVVKWCVIAGAVTRADEVNRSHLGRDAHGRGGVLTFHSRHVKSCSPTSCLILSSDLLNYRHNTLLLP